MTSAMRRFARRFQLLVRLAVSGIVRKVIEQIALLQLVVDGGEVRNHVEVREQAEAFDEEDALRDRGRARQRLARGLGTISIAARATIA